MIITKILVFGFVAVVALTVLFYLVLGVISLTVKEEPMKESKKIYKVACRAFCTWAVGMAGVRTHVTGEEKIPEEGRFLFVSNHKALFDPLVVGYRLWKYEIGFLSKPSNMKIPFLGRLSWGAGYMALDRENDRNALKTILAAVDYLKKDFCSVGIYPEGTRSKTDEILPFHKGSFKIATKAKVPVVIASVKNTEQVFKNVPFRTTDVYLDIIEVIPAEKVCTMKTWELADYSYKKIKEHLHGK